MPSKKPTKKKSTSSRKKASSQLFPFSNDPLFFKQLFGYIANECLVVDAQGRVVFVNDSAVDALGYSRSYILRKKIVDFLNGKITVNQWKKKYFNFLKRKKTPISYRIERVTKKKEVQTIDVTVVYLCYDQKEYIFSIGRDVTRQMDLQKSLHDSKNLYRFLTEGTTEGIAALDPDGKFVYANKSLQKMLGMRGRGGYQGKPFSRFIAKSDLSKGRSIMERVKKGRRHVQAVIDAQSMAGEIIPFEISATPLLKSGQVVSIHMIVRDLRIRQKIADMNRHAEKMEALRYFMAGTAQELKNPLMGVARRSEMLLKRYAERDFEYISYKEFRDIIANLESIRDQVQYCYDTSRRLMTMGQKRAGITRGHCHVNKVIQNVIRDKQCYMHQHEIEPKISLVSTKSEVRISSVDLMQVLYNLIDNAIQAMPSGGVLTVKTSLAPSQKMFVIEIRDRGVGIPKEQLQHIFEPFFTTKTRGIRKNSGLGLPIAYSLLNDSQGDIQIKSSLRKGTSVIISLPLFRLK